MRFCTVTTKRNVKFNGKIVKCNMKPGGVIAERNIKFNGVTKT
jgi:hypothetical protein